MPTRLLVEAGHSISLFYSNSNIAPAAEYAKRLDVLRGYAGKMGVPVLEGAYDPDAWERTVAPIGNALKEYSPAFGTAFAEGLMEVEAAGTGTDAGTGEGADACVSAVPSGAREARVLEPVADIQSVAELLDDERRCERCRACYRLRLEEAAEVAVRGGFDGLATTLAVSPYQFTDVIREELQRAAAKAGIEAHFEDYRPYYEQATRISRDLGMYRQNYCGCRFSIREGEATRAFIKQRRKAAKAARAAARAADERAARARKAEKRAYAEEQARKRAVLKELRAKNRSHSGESAGAGESSAEGATA
jgi:hypothetical protein